MRIKIKIINTNMINNGVQKKYKIKRPGFMRFKRNMYLENWYVKNRNIKIRRVKYNNNRMKNKINNKN